VEPAGVAHFSIHDGTDHVRLGLIAHTCCTSYQGCMLYVVCCMAYARTIMLCTAWVSLRTTITYKSFSLLMLLSHLPQTEAARPDQTRAGWVAGSTRRVQHTAQWTATHESGRSKRLHADRTVSSESNASCPVRRMDSMALDRGYSTVHIAAEARTSISVRIRANHASDTAGSVTGKSRTTLAFSCAVTWQRRASLPHHESLRMRGTS
jgi:hypothetical protein